MTEILGYERARPGEEPPYLHRDYGSTVKRAPLQRLLRVEHTLSEVTGPSFADGWAGADEADLTRQNKSEPLGERMIVAGRVLDEHGRAVPGTLVELWQANSAGRYLHEADQHDAPLDPNFSGAGHVVTSENGEYRFVTIIPGAYPWRNTHNAWRAQHLHFSVFGAGFAARVITQMYFPGDPLMEYDPIFHSVPDAAARTRLVSRYDPDLSVSEWALGYRFDIVLRGRAATPTGI
jgi:protocatechuate 3,4-dioxygenase, beta subunit